MTARRTLLSLLVALTPAAAPLGVVAHRAAALRLAAPPPAAPQRRIAPPASIACDHNRLTSFTGRVVSYRRTPGRVALRVRTDEATNESFSIPLTKARGASAHYLLNGEPFKAADWKLIERRAGSLRPRMRATVWVCEGGAATTVDWRPGERDPTGVY